jgi:hypothetical protein
LRDRSGTVIAVVAIGIAVLGLAALARSLARKWESRRRFGRSDVARWFRSGWEAMRPLLPALLVLLSMWTAADLVRIHGWAQASIRSDSVWQPPPPSFPERLRQAADLRGLSGALFTAWRKLQLLPWNWPLGFLPVLLVAAGRRRFPFSSTRAVVRTWLTLGIVFLGEWLYGYASHFLPAPAAPVALAGFVSLAFLLIGYPAFLMLLIANVDSSAERRLEKGPVAARETLLRVAAVVAAGSLAVIDRAAFTYWRTVMHWNLRMPLVEAVGWVFTVAGALLGFFASTALLPACSSATPGVGFVRQTWQWWKRDGLFLLAMPVAVTLAGAIVSFPIEIPLVGWRSPGSPGELLKTDLHVVFGSLGAFAANLLAFVLLLGNWLEARTEFEAAPSAA